MRASHASIVFAVALIAGPGLALADSFTEATFSGGIEPGNANVLSPFAGNGFTQGDTFTGTFVFDNQSVPGGGTGYVNVGFPAVATIPASTEFSFDLDGLSLNFENQESADPAFIQYNNGQFNGFVYTADFLFHGSQYQFQSQGGTFDVLKLDASGNPILGTNYISGYINIGNSSLTGEQNYTPPSAVPLPPSMALLIPGLMGLMLMRRRGPIATGPIAI